MPSDPGSEDSYGGFSINRRDFLSVTGLVVGSIGNSLFSTPVAADARDVPLEVLSVSATHSWKWVGIDGSFEDPVVVAGPVSYNGNHRAHPRLRNVSSDDFDISVEEWAYMDTLHIEEAIHCLAVEQGAYTLEDGTALVAGQVTSNHERTSVSFPSSFSTTPVVFSDAQTYNHSRPVVTRQPKISESGFVVRLQGSERRSSHEKEDIGYVAIEPGTGTANGRAFEVGVQNGIDHEWSTIEFDGTYTEPAFIADMQTVAGPDSSGLRYRNLTGSSVDVRVEEEQSNDDEVVHAEEDVGYLVAGAASSEATPSPSPEPSAPEGETGEGDGFGVDEYGFDRFGV